MIYTKIMEENDQIEKFVDIYRNVSSIPSPLSATYFPMGENFLIESEWTTRDLVKMQNTTFTKTYVGCNDDEMNIMCTTTHDSTNSKKVAYSIDGKYKAILREGLKDKETVQYLEIWKENRKIHTHDVFATKQHGKIYHEGLLSTFAWNESNDTLLYVAEKYVPKAVSYFKQENESPSSSGNDTSEKNSDAATKGTEFLYEEDWGEVYAGKIKSVICTYNVPTKKVTVLPIISDDCVFLTQPIWKNNNTIIFVGINEVPYKLGLIYCFNRKSTIYNYEIDTGMIDVMTKLCHCDYSIRFNPDNQELIYLQNEVLGPHKDCSRLVKYDPESACVVVEVVKNAKGEEFPGIYAEKFPNRCFSRDGNYVFITSIWRSTHVILCIELNTGKVQPLCTGGCSVLDVYDDVIIASASSPNTEPYLIAGKISYTNESVSVSWNKLDKVSKISDIHFERRTMTPHTVNPAYSNLDYEIILLTPEGQEKCDNLILFNHGGPHSTFTTDYSLMLTVFVKAGYSICLVNYRGSLGFGSDSVHSLPKNIGVQDVEDCYHALTTLKKDDMFKEAKVFLTGGSHGGFLGAHLSAQYPDAFVSCCLRNPVVDLLGMLEGTDIPDWNWTEAGVGSEFKYLYPNADQQMEMWNRSPLKIANNVKVPTLLLLGKVDRRVPCTQGMKYYRILKTNHVPVKVYLYDDNHSLSTLPAESDGIIQILLWFEKCKNAQTSV